MPLPKENSMRVLGVPSYKCPVEVTEPSHTRKTKYVLMGRLSWRKSVIACWLVPWAVGDPPKTCLGVRCDTKDNWYSLHTVLSPSQELSGVTFLCSDLQGLVFKWTRVCPLETKAYVWALHSAGTNSQLRHPCSMVWQYWVGSAHNYKPALCEISARSLHLFLGSFTSPSHSLSLQALS